MSQSFASNLRIKLVFWILFGGVLVYGYDCSDRILIKLKTDLSSFVKSGCHDSSLYAPITSALNDMAKQTSDTYYKKNCPAKTFDPKVVASHVGQGLNFALFPSQEGGRPECISELSKALKMLEGQAGEIEAAPVAAPPSSTTTR